MLSSKRIWLAFLTLVFILLFSYGCGSNPPTTSTPAVYKYFLYVTNQNSGNISMFEINTASGGLTSIGVPVTAGTQPFAIETDSAGKYAYATNVGSNDIYIYSITKTTGALVFVASVSSGVAPFNLTISPNGQYLYTANLGSANVSMYQINSTTGLLTPLGTASAGSSPFAVVVDDSTQYAYVSNLASGDIYGYTISPTGTLTFSASVSVGVGTGPSGLEIDHGGKNFLYVCNSGNNTVSSYRINPANGQLTFSNNIAAGTQPYELETDPLARYAYAVNVLSHDISSYSINQTTGALTPLPASGTVLTGTAVQSPYGIHDESGYFYVSNQTTSMITIFAQDAATGILTQVGAQVATGGSAPVFIVTAAVAQ